MPPPWRRVGEGLSGFPSSTRFCDGTECRCRRVVGSARTVDVRDHRLSQVSSARAIPRARRPHETRGLPRLGILGSTGAGLRGSRGAGPRHRPGSGGSRRQPHGTRLHGGPERRMVVPDPVSRGFLEPAEVGFEGRRTRPSGLLHRRRGAVRSAAEQAHADRVRSLPAVLGARSHAPTESARRRGPRGRSDGIFPPNLARGRSQRPIPCAEVPPWRQVGAPADYAARVVSPKPAEHADGPPHTNDVRPGLRIGGEDYPGHTMMARTGALQVNLV